MTNPTTKRRPLTAADAAAEAVTAAIMNQSPVKFKTSATRATNTAAMVVGLAFATALALCPIICLIFGS